MMSASTLVMRAWAASTPARAALAWAANDATPAQLELARDEIDKAPALDKEQADDLHAGCTQRVKGGGLTNAELFNQFLTAKLRKREAGEITIRSFGEYTPTADRIVAQFGVKRLVDDLAADGAMVSGGDVGPELARPHRATRSLSS